ncbi:hypothetical protein C8J56DRAFT_1064378 [Mycena floridula]|nr:hypothetical protein C8J56DRAFT_1064378 [Mycena floridula]
MHAESVDKLPLSSASVHCKRRRTRSPTQSPPTIRKAGIPVYSGSASSCRIFIASSLLTPILMLVAFCCFLFLCAHCSSRCGFSVARAMVDACYWEEFHSGIIIVPNKVGRAHCSPIWVKLIAFDTGAEATSTIVVTRAFSSIIMTVVVSSRCMLVVSSAASPLPLHRPASFVGSLSSSSSPPPLLLSLLPPVLIITALLPGEVHPYRCMVESRLVDLWEALTMDKGFREALIRERNVRKPLSCIIPSSLYAVAFLHVGSVTVTFVVVVVGAIILAVVLDDTRKLETGLLWRLCCVTILHDHPRRCMDS